MTKQIKSGIRVLFLGSIVLMLPGCGFFDWFKSKVGKGSPCSMHDHGTGVPAEMEDEDVYEGDELASIDGKPIVSTVSLERDFDLLLDENPQLRQILPLMPDAKYNVFKGMVNQAIVDKYIQDNGLDQTDEYKKEERAMIRSVKRMLNTKYFGEAHPVAVSDNEIRKFYEENKESMPDLLLSRGGVQAVGVSFDSEATAKEFLAKAKDKDLEKVAKESGLQEKFEDFNLVNDFSLGINQDLREKIVAIEKFPTTEVVKADDKTFWVVKATAKKNPEYRSLDTVKDGLRQYVEKEERMKMYDREIDRLKNEWKVVMNEDYFKTDESDEQDPGQMLENLDNQVDVKQLRTVDNDEVADDATSTKAV